MIRRLLVAMAAAAFLLGGIPATAGAGSGEDICSVEVLGWRPC